MKFRSGFWLLRPEYEATYAVELFSAETVGNEIHALAASQHIAGRGATLSPALFVRLFSPMEGVIGVEITHFAGQVKNAPQLPLADEPPAVRIQEDESGVSLTSGALTARINKAANGWGIDFVEDANLLTATGYRGMAHMRNRNTKQGFVVEQLKLSVGEHIYGLGERFTPFVKNGQVVDMWNADGGTCTELAYKNVPFYLSSRGYGVYVDSASDVSYEVGSEQVERVQFSIEDERLRYFVIAGPTPKEALSRYTRLTGRPALPPPWSFGLWLSTSFTTNYDEATTTSFINGMRERDIPLDVFHFDCFWMRPYRWCDFTWDAAVFPDPEGMLRRYHKMGLKICVWINPYIGQQSTLFKEAMEAGYLIRRTDGSVWQTDLWQAGMGVVDFTNPDAARWYQDKLRQLVHMGVDCFKTDFGERIPVRDIVFHNGLDPVAMHNYYTQLYNAAVFELLEQEKGKGNAVLFARSATAGGQQYPAHWGGDNAGTYESMAETLRGGLSLAASGFAFWSHDISGFEQTAPAHVYKRWCAFGLLSSHSRLHGSQSYRVPWLFDEESVSVLRFFAKLKCRLMPYLFRMAVIAHEEGIPIMRPMFLAFPGDPACETLDRQYMLGDSLLVAPVFSESGEVTYYLPHGTWTHLLDGRVQEGGQWMKEVYDFHSLPLWVKENTVLPWGGTDHTAAYDYTAGLTLRAYQVSKPVTVNIPAQDGTTALSVTVGLKGGALTCDPPGEYLLVNMGGE